MISRTARDERIASKRYLTGLDLLARKVLFSVGIATCLIFSQAATAATYNLLVSSSASRSNAVPLSGQGFSDNIYVFTSPDQGVSRVNFYLDGSRQIIDRNKPYDFGGTANDGKAVAYDPTRLSTGAHTITALLLLKEGGAVTIQRTFTVGNGAATSLTGSATLSWVAPSTRADGSPLSLSAIAGYRIYHGTVTNQLSLLRSINDPTATSYKVPSLPAGTHFFAISTRDTSGLEGSRSAVIKKTIQ